VPSGYLKDALQIAAECQAYSLTAKQIYVERIATDVECQVDSSRVPSGYLWDAQQMAMNYQANIPAEELYIKYLLLLYRTLLS